MTLIRSPKVNRASFSGPYIIIVAAERCDTGLECRAHGIGAQRLGFTVVTVVVSGPGCVTTVPL